MKAMWYFHQKMWGRTDADSARQDRSRYWGEGRGVPPPGWRQP
jgi:uncharacterized membrane protein